MAITVVIAKRHNFTYVQGTRMQHGKTSLKISLWSYQKRTSVPISIPVFFNTPHSVIPYRFFDTGAVSNICSEIRRRNHMDSQYGVSLAVY
jgi:hypothetical protein